MAVHVPVELVVVGKVADLARRAVGDLVSVRAVREQHVRTSDADTLAVPVPLERPALARAVAGDAHHLERDL